MVITCPSCAARYRLDSSKIKGRGAKITCPNCAHVFVVFGESGDGQSNADGTEISSGRASSAAASAAASSDDLSSPAAASSAALDAYALDFRSVGLDAWRVKVSIGLVYDFSDLRTLEKYIADRKVTEADLISHDHSNWTRIGDIASLQAHFCAVYRELAVAGHQPLAPRSTDRSGLERGRLPPGGRALPGGTPAPDPETQPTAMAMRVMTPGAASARVTVQMGVPPGFFSPERVEVDRLRGLLLQGAEVWNAARMGMREPMLAGVDLSGSDLRGVDLRYAILDGAVLDGAQLDEADLTGARLVGTSLDRARLHGARLAGAALSRARFRFADCREGVFAGASGQGGTFSGADLTRADFTKARLRETDFGGANMRHTVLSDADLTGGEFPGARLHGATLEGCVVSGADFSGASILAAELAGADLARSRFGGSVIAATDLSGAILQGTIHYAPSTVGVDTLRLSTHRSVPGHGTDLREFLERCGLAGSTIDAVAALSGSDGAYQTAFISHHSADSAFALQLYKRLQAAGVRCWIDKIDLRGDVDILEGLYDAIRRHERVVLVCSERALESSWVEDEVRMAVEKEREAGEFVLLPVHLDESYLSKRSGLMTKLRARRSVSFAGWGDDGVFEAGLALLLRDLARG